MTSDWDRLLRRGVAEVILEDELRKLLGAGRPVRLKFGLDPSRPDLHLGHAVALRKLRQLQELGHHVILIVGDWTAQIGDPSGQSATRNMLTPDEVRANAETYMQQFFRIVDPERTQAIYQSDWYGKFSLADVIFLTSKFTVAQMLAREDFARRFGANRPIVITELLYPLLQAYDSVAIQADVEFGGTDQRFNILLGRELQSALGQVPQQAFLVPILTGTDGTQKMSKSLGNCIGIAEPPDEMYGKLMSIPDRLIGEYFELLTDVTDEEMDDIRRSLEAGTTNPMVLKKRLAFDIVSQFHSPALAEGSAAEFERVHQRREMPDDVPVVRLEPQRFAGPIAPADLVFAAGLAASRSEARRLVTGGGVRLDGEKLGDSPVYARDGSVLQVGRRRFARLIREVSQS